MTSYDIQWPFGLNSLRSSLAYTVRWGFGEGQVNSHVLAGSDCKCSHYINNSDCYISIDFSLPLD
jgi:hypothetical protein